MRVTLWDFEATTAGLVLSSYFVGFTVGAVFCGRIIDRIGHIRVHAAFADLVVAATTATPLLVGPLSWLVLRAVVGFGCAGLFVTTESWLNAKARPSEGGRPRLLGLHGRHVRCSCTWAASVRTGKGQDGYAVQYHRRPLCRGAGHGE